MVIFYKSFELPPLFQISCLIATIGKYWATLCTTFKLLIDEPMLRLYITDLKNYLLDIYLWVTHLLNCDILANQQGVAPFDESLEYVMGNIWYMIMRRSYNMCIVRNWQNTHIFAQIKGQPFFSPTYISTTSLCPCAPPCISTAISSELKPMEKNDVHSGPSLVFWRWP
jgi:hypothetical protein